MSYENRKELYKQLIEQRQRPLITYVTSLRSNMGGCMAGDAIRPFINQLNAIPTNENEIDFIIVSNGGDPITSLRIMSLLRERFKKISVLIPYVAYSAATTLALGADEILMHPYSNLGPIDPQLTVSHKGNNGKQEKFQFSSEDLVNYIDFIKKDIGITDQLHLTESIQPLIENVGALAIGSAKRGQMLSLSLSERMLSSHIADSNKVKTISRALNSSYYHHGYAVGRTEAKKMGLPVLFPKKEIEELLWNIWLDYENEMKCNETFDPIKELMKNPSTSNILNSVSTIQFPVNIPQEAQQNIIQFLIPQLKIQEIPPLDLDFLIASIESINRAEEFRNHLKISYWRGINANLEYNITCISNGWATK